jgi:hypothetical protein
MTTITINVTVAEELSANEISRLAGVCMEVVEERLSEEGLTVTGSSGSGGD